MDPNGSRNSVIEYYNIISTLTKDLFVLAAAPILLAKKLGGGI